MKRFTFCSFLVGVVLFAGIAVGENQAKKPDTAVPSWGYLQTAADATTVADAIRDYEMERGWVLTGEQGSEKGDLLARIELTAKNDAGNAVGFELIAGAERLTTVRVHCGPNFDGSEITAELASALNCRVLK